MPVEAPRRITRQIRVGSVFIGGESPIVIQSMTATKTQDIAATVSQVRQLEQAGAGLVRIAIDSLADAKALAEIRAQTTANLSVDLQENWDNLLPEVAPYADEIRYNPGHLHHHRRTQTTADKVAYIAEVADRYGRAIRIGVNCGSVDPELAAKFGAASIEATIESGLIHTDLLDRLGFPNFNVSIKDSDPMKVIEVNSRFAALRQDVPLHLGVTKAGLPPIGIIIRFSLTVPNDRKFEEIEAGKQLVEDIASGRLLQPDLSEYHGPNIVSCPSCSRVENSRFVELAQQISEATRGFSDRNLTIAVMGCRVNGPGETDKANFGVWCGPNFVNLKKGDQTVGTFSYDEILPHLLIELNTRQQT